jgi:alcohol dehydrogenase
VHAIAHPVGSWFNTHHGLTNAVILPYVMTYNRNVIDAKTDVIARVLDLPTRGFDGFLAWVLKMRVELGIPHSLTHIGVNINNAAVIGSEAALDPSAGGNPIPVNAAQLEHIFRAAVAGQLEAVESAA